MKKTGGNNSGQILTSVVVFVAFGLSVIALSAALTIINMQNSVKSIEGTRALNYAEAGAEEALLRIIRNPDYAGGSLPIDTATVSIQVVGDATTKTATSTAVYNGFTRKIQVVVNLVEGKVSLVSWKQIV